MTETLFLIVSTMCFDVNMPIQYYPRLTQEKCVQTVRISTSSAVREGETAYRVIPATATVHVHEDRLFFQACMKGIEPCRVLFLWEMHKQEAHKGDFAFPCEDCQYWYKRAEEILRDEMEP